MSLLGFYHNEFLFTITLLLNEFMRDAYKLSSVGTLMGGLLCTEIHYFVNRRKDITDTSYYYIFLISKPVYLLVFFQLKKRNHCFCKQLVGMVERISRKVSIASKRS